MTNKTKLPQLILLTALTLTIGCTSMTTQYHQYPSLHDDLILEMETVFADTRSMIDHTNRVYQYALQIHQTDGGDPTIVLASAMLHDIGIPQARITHGSSAGRFQEIEGPPIAREILTRHNVQPEKIDHICSNIANHHTAHDPKITDTIEFKILWDADWMINFPNRNRNKSPQEITNTINEIFKTNKGKQLALKTFIK
ncbi:MAG: HD domain-containing protein [Planctomycetes bacterium]|nr:HD domain-containing protein [Planctomycetota bacterium]